MSNEVQENDEHAPHEELDASAEDATEAEEQSAEEKRYRRRIVWKQRLFKWTDELSNSAGYAVWVMAAFVAILFLVPYALNLQSTVVLTESMSGTIEKGDVILTKSFSSEHDKLEVGDVALFKNAGSSFTHRVESVNEDGTYTMRGDANDSADLFKPSNDDIEAVVFNTVHQPQAGILSLFTLNWDWFRVFWAAVSTGQWSVAGGLVPMGPWGVMILVLAAVLFWVVIPRVLQRIVAKANLRAALELERIRRSVAAHEEAITEHDESLNEIEPVVEEIKEEKARKEAEDAALAEAQAKAWDEADFTKIYDEPEDSSDDDAFFDVYNKQFNTDIPSAWTPEPAEDSAFDVFETFAPRSLSGGLPLLSDPTPRFAPNAPTNPFDRIAPRVAVTRSEVTRASLRAEPDEFAALGIRASDQSRNEASAFDLEEI